MTFDYATMGFSNSRGIITGVLVSRNKRGRFYYRTESGRLLASGMSPERFAQEFWGAKGITIVNGIES